MSRPGDERSRISPELSPGTLGLASLSAVVATLLVSRFGLAGSLAGAALTPVVVTVVRELARNPVEKVVRLPSGARALAGRAPRVRPRVVVITSVIAFVVAVAAFTIPELLRGSSVASDRDSTFFSGGGGGGGGGGATTTEDAPAVTTRAGTVEAPATAPEEGATAPLPEVTVPTITAPPAVPATPAPAPAPEPVAPAAPAAPAPAAPTPPATTAPAMP